MKLRIATLLLLAALTGCASLPGAQIQTVNQRNIELVVRPGKPPAVVFENGLSGRMEWWAKVLPALPGDTAYFAYNRPGYGNSSAAVTARDGAHVVDELRAALAANNLRPPYVLVGHSLGGLYMQLFARQYPDEVAALVLVDSTHPTQLEGAGAMENQSLWVRGLVGMMVTGVAKEELALLPRTGEQVLGLPTLSGKPVYVLSAAEPMKETSELARFYNAKRMDIARLYPGSRQVWVESGHGIPLEKPQAVVEAIINALSDVRR